MGTATDFLISAFCKANFQSEEKFGRNSGLARIMLCFSARANTKLLLEVNQNPRSDAFAYRFLHGMRFFSIYGVVLGHSFCAFNFTSTSRLVNALHYGDSWWFCIIMSAYLCVDTFLFIG
ncbi:nose resistant to fluoxetine protein 6-like [Tropilaelaps mercedesae]|uniref:Nose resistant to fluoxetine protein 6-like n=1 Tax=Tropilaelaps mercedesae TaxID=418985 RepID=A0A1V9XIX0_9ACAR|nr:nose resistant to fluoxetine protein 6-like [Tropilaelaps mercedesae]